ncbi:predicted protein [Chaetoceros tenuissimus]|nr:predicted protein [Chaetoceros tenuissimus]
MNASGLLNALVYFRLRYSRIRKEYHDCQGVHILVNILKDTLLPSFAPSCCGRKREFSFEDLEPTLHESADLNSDDSIEEQKKQPLRSKNGINRAIQNLAATEEKSCCRNHEKNGNGSSTRTTTTSTASYPNGCEKKMHFEPTNLQRDSSMREDWRTLRAAGVQTSISKFNDSNRTMKSNENSINAQKPKSLRSIPDIDDDQQEDEAWVDLTAISMESLSKREILRTSMREDWRALKAAGVQTSNSTMKSNENSIDAQKPKSLRSIPDIDTESNAEQEEEEEAWVDLTAFHIDRMSKREILRTSMREEWRALKAAGVQTSNSTLKSNELTKTDEEPSKTETTKDCNAKKNLQRNEINNDIQHR